MPKLYAAFLLFLFCGILQMRVSGQSVINPADTIVNFTVGSNPTIPAWGTIAKWGRTPSQSWNTTEWKCYIYNGLPFRIHFPKSYVPGVNDGKKYPLLLFFHGAGETGPATDNELSLFHGGTVFQAAIDNGTFDGYAVVPQEPGNGWGITQFNQITPVLDYMVANNKVDFARIVVNGLSAGGLGTWDFDHDFPNYVAAAIPMSGISADYITSNYGNTSKFTDFWNFQGGQDGTPSPFTANAVVSYLNGLGADITLTIFPTQGHDTWDSTWLVPGFWPFMNAGNAANPWPLFGHSTFCTGQTINATLGLAPGYQAYQWRLNGTVIPGATTNQITATQAGTYDAAIEKNGVWSSWSPIPVQIVVQANSITPPITQVNVQTLAIPGPDGTNSVNLALPAGDSVYAWYKLGSPTVLGTTNAFTAAGPGDYYATAVPKFGCTATPSPVFEVINAAGPNAPSAPTSPSAVSLGYTKTMVTWATQPNPANAPTAFELYRGTHTGGPYTYLGQTTPSVLTFTDSVGLSPATKYYYIIRAIDTTGASPVSSPEAVVTTTSDVTPPTAPSNLRVTGTTNTTISLAWTAATDNVSVNHYAIYLNGQLTDISTDTTFILTGLTQQQWYAIYIVAVDGSGNQSIHSGQLSAEAIYSGLNYNFYTSTTNLTSVSNLTTMVPTASGTSPNTLITIYPAITTNFGYLWTGYITIPKSGTYHFATSSDDGSELWFNSSTPTGTPTVNNDGLHGTTQVNSATLNLTAGTYPICIGYFQQGGGVAMTTLWSSQVVNGNTNYVSIPNQYFAGTPTSPGTVPARPTNIKATATSYSSINVTWKDNSNNETGFEVYRGSSANGPFNIVTTSPAGSTSYTDNGLTGATAYYYKVQAVNVAGGSGFDSLSLGGLNYNLYSGAFGSPMPNFLTLTPVSSGHMTNVSITAAGSLTTNFGLLFFGNIKAPVTGTYTFSTNSDDASALYIGGYPATTFEVVNNDFQQGATTRSGTIALTAGQSYPFYVSYDQGGGSFVVSTYWQLPGSSTTTAIPDSAFANPNWTATTFGLPSAPVAPTLVATPQSPSKIALSWSDTSSAINGYTLNRSIGDSLHFLLLATLPAGTTTYMDTALFGHQTYYYKVQASGPGGNSAFTAAIGAVTKDNAPAVAQIANQFARYGVTTTININATDADGDPMTFTPVNLPSFINLSGNTNGTATLTIIPSSSNAGNWPGIGYTVSDGFGGNTTVTFNLTVNNNTPPVFTTIAPVSVNTGGSLSIPITATYGIGDSLVFAVSGAPKNYALHPGPNGSDTLVLNPTPGAAGSYTVSVTANDNNGGVTTTTFPVTVNLVALTKTVFLRVNDGDVVGAPWNNFTSQITPNLLDSSGANTGWTFNLNTSWWGGYAVGPWTGNNSGIYPDGVLHDYYFFGNYGAPTTIAPSITGLDTTKHYNITLFGASAYTGVGDNGTTVYSSEGQSVPLYVQNNINRTATLVNLKPDATGTITITMSLQTDGTPLGYINALVITQLFDDGTTPLSPGNLKAALASGGPGVTLTWSDSAYNETGYEIWRATSATGTFTQILPDPGPKATTFTDTSVAGNTTYYYKVRALNVHGYSNYTNVASVSTPDRVPTLNAVANVSLAWGTSTTVPVTTSGASGNTVTLTAQGLPSFASFMDNGNGTGVLTINAPDSTSGNYPGVTITMTDAADSIRTTTFAILVKNPLVSSVYIHFSDGVNNGSSPWNNLSFYPNPGWGQSNLLNDNGVNSGIGLVYSNGFETITATGDVTGNNSGIYADPLMASCLNEGGTQTDSILISGLNTALHYNFSILSSANWGISGNTIFTLMGQTQSINPAYNTHNLVQFNNIKPRANGTVSLGVSKASAAQYSFLNDLVIQSFDSTKLSLLGPSNLNVTTVTRNSIGLSWTDNSWNETGFEIWRATDTTGVFTKVGTVAAGITSYTNTGLTSNTRYAYTVRAIKGSLPSTYTSPAYATTTSYAVYLEMNIPNTNVAGLPWNPLNQQPSDGTTWLNLHDDLGNPTSTKAVLHGTTWDPTGTGISTGNNSGVYPDIVMADDFTLFSNNTGSFTLSGLNINYDYDVTLFASFFISDAVARYTVTGTTSTTLILDASNNTTSTVTAYHTRPDQNGSITVTLTPNLPTTAWAALATIVLRAYAHDSVGLPNLPAANQTVTQSQTMTGVTNDASATVAAATGDTVIVVYPNPYKTSFTLQVPGAGSDDRAMVEMYTETGQQVYANEFKGLLEGPNYITVTPPMVLQTGIYMLRVSTKNARLNKVVKLMKE